MIMIFPYHQLFFKCKLCLNLSLFTSSSPFFPLSTRFTFFLPHLHPFNHLPPHFHLLLSPLVFSLAFHALSLHTLPSFPLPYKNVSLVPGRLIGQCYSRLSKRLGHTCTSTPSPVNAVTPKAISCSGAHASRHRFIVL